jgi:Putative prokaryotic signal transducing protein
MAQIDPEQERTRLASVYAAQTDEELESVAGQGAELTDIAREVLRAELSKRGLYIGQLEEISAEEDSAEFRNLVTVRTFGNLAEAELAKGLLDSAGIESFLFDENMGRLYWINVTQGIKLRVDPENAEAATGILDENVSEFTAPEDVRSDDPDARDPDPST